MIVAPGIYRGIATADYLADPCPQPSLTQSLAKTLLRSSPLHAWYRHPRLNPDYEPETADVFDLGSACHALLLGRGKEIVVLDYQDWRTKAAREKREEARAAGQVPMLAKHWDRARYMHDAAMAAIRAAHIPMFADSEVCLAWQEEHVWLRQLLDWVTSDFDVILDYKTTSESAAPGALARKMMADGWILQAAMAERGLDILNPASSGRRRYLFACQETYAPWAMSICEIAEGPLTIGRKQLARAVRVWADCTAANVFPSYPRQWVAPDLPAWAEAEWLAEEEAHAEKEQGAQGDARVQDGEPAFGI